MPMPMVRTTSAASLDRKIARNEVTGRTWIGLAAEGIRTSGLDQLGGEAGATNSLAAMLPPGRSGRLNLG